MLLAHTHRHRQRHIHADAHTHRDPNPHRHPPPTTKHPAPTAKHPAPTAKHSALSRRRTVSPGSVDCCKGAKLSMRFLRQSAEDFGQTSSIHFSEELAGASSENHIVRRTAMRRIAASSNREGSTSAGGLSSMANERQADSAPKVQEVTTQSQVRKRLQHQRPFQQGI